MKTKLLLVLIIIISAQLAKADDRGNLFDIKNYNIQLNLKNISSKTLSATTIVELQSKSNKLSSIRFGFSQIES
jgi:hypothetical protein